MKKILKGVRRTPKKLPICIRWVGAFRGGYSPSESISFEFKNSKEIKPFEAFFSCSKIAAKVGLLISPTSKFHRFYPVDCWSEKTPTKKLKAERKYLPFVTTLDRVWGLLQKFYGSRWDQKVFSDYKRSGKYVEGWVENPLYIGVVIKETTPKAINVAKMFAAYSNLPIYKLEGNKFFLWEEGKKQVGSTPATPYTLEVEKK